MKSKPFALVLGAIALIALSAACGRPAETPPPAVEALPVAEVPAPPAETAPAAAPVDALPETLPATLTTAPDLNTFAVDLMLKNVPPNVFSSSTVTEEERAKARKALKLAVEAFDKAIGLYDRNESFYYGRAQALHAQFTDTKDAALKEKALADLDRALAINPKHSPSKTLRELISK